MLTNVIFIEGLMTTERWNQLATALGKLGWQGRVFLTSQGQNAGAAVISGKWSFELTEAATREGLTPQQSALLDAIEAGNIMAARKGSPVARALDAMVELGLITCTDEGESLSYSLAKASQPAANEPA